MRAGLLTRVSYTSAISACASAEAAALLIKSGLTAAETELLSEKVRHTLQTMLQAEAVDALTREELKQIVVETAAANGFGVLSDAQAALPAQYLLTGRAVGKLGGSMLNFSNIVAGMEKFQKLHNISFWYYNRRSAVVYAIVKISQALTTTLGEAKEKSDELSEDIKSYTDEIERLEDELAMENGAETAWFIKIKKSAAPAATSAPTASIRRSASGRRPTVCRCVCSAF